MNKLAFNHNLLDDNLRKLVALPNAASSTVNSAPLDLQGAGVTGYPGYLETFELGVNIPALTATQLPNGATLTATVQVSNDPTFATGVQTLTLYPAPGSTASANVATGANAAGAVATEGRCRIPAQCPRYARAVFTTGAGTGDVSAVTGEFAAIF